MAWKDCPARLRLQQGHQIFIDISGDRRGMNQQARWFADRQQITVLINYLYLRHQTQYGQAAVFAHSITLTEVFHME